MLFGGFLYLLLLCLLKTRVGFLEKKQLTTGSVRPFVHAKKSRRVYARSRVVSTYKLIKKKIAKSVLDTTCERIDVFGA